MDKLLSIVITCFNRKEFLLDAVKSAISQSISRDTYDIIVIKNFSEKKIDEFLAENAIVNVLAENGSTGSWFKIAANVVDTKYISFLDDDDIFHPDKVAIILSILNLYPNSDFIHNCSERRGFANLKLDFRPNRVRIIDDSSVTSFRNSLKQNLYFNLSSITIRKDLITEHLDFIKETNHGTDIVMYAASQLSDGIRIQYDEFLTFYRVHTDSHANYIEQNQHIFEETKREVLPYYIKNWGLISNFLGDTPMGIYASLRLISTKIWINLVSDNTVYKLSSEEVFKGLKYFHYYHFIILFMIIQLFDNIFHRPVKKLYFLFIFSRIGSRLRGQI
ncbi:MAG: glycosyltransferase family A protein [Thermoplasmatales archaeon]